MSDPRPERQHRHIECDDCHATPETGDSHTIGVGPDWIEETWHTENCPQLAVTRILLEDSARQVREREAWAEEAFPAAQERMKAAAAELPASAADPFIAALSELVEAQGEGLGRFVTIDRWVEILERHFPPR